MKKVITYGTYDVLHYGHIKLLENAKALGDYLIVGVTSDDYDKTRGKINIQESLMTRIENVKALGIADEVIVEEYEGQKIDDIIKYDIDIFTVGSDWEGYFDYLNEYCQVVYLPRTVGVSSSELRSENRKITLGIVGDSDIVSKFAHECSFVNGISLTGICSNEPNLLPQDLQKLECVTNDYNKLLNCCDAVYIVSKPCFHYNQIKLALLQGKHVLCESPISLSQKDYSELTSLAQDHNLILTESNKTAYSTAYNRLLLLIKSGKIGDVVSIDATCTSLTDIYYLDNPDHTQMWGSLEAWGSRAMLPIFQILGKDYTQLTIVSKLEDNNFDTFSKVDFIYSNAVASLKVGNGVKSEGDLIISGTKGYIYVPSPWWKTDYFELRYENSSNNKRYFYQLDGEGIRYLIVAFAKAISGDKKSLKIDGNVSNSIAQVFESFNNNYVIKI